MWGGSPMNSNDSTFDMISNKEILYLQKNTANNHQLYQPNQRSDFKDYRIWVADDKKSKSKYVALFNLRDTAADIIFKPEWELWKGKFKAKEVWTGQEVTVEKELKALQVQPHGVMVYKFEQ
jgi:Alpha galactosidase C-terminal beta sandwich domain